MLPVSQSYPFNQCFSIRGLAWQWKRIYRLNRSWRERCFQGNCAHQLSAVSSSAVLLIDTRNTVLIGIFILSCIWSLHFVMIFLNFSTVLAPSPTPPKKVQAGILYLGWNKQQSLDLINKNISHQAYEQPFQNIISCMLWNSEWVDLKLRPLL